MAEHWTVTHDEWANYYAVFNGDELIAELFYAKDIPEAQEAQRRKAHTIAAAPALIEALECVYRTLRPQYQGGNTLTTVTLRPESVEIIREALRLARGGQG